MDRQAQRRALEARLETLANHAGIARPDLEARRNRNLASLTRTGPAGTVVVDPRVLDAPTPIQDRVLGHELAHLINGDHLHQAASRQRRAFCAALFAAATCSALTGIAFNSDDRWLSILLLITIALALTAMAIMGAVTRPREFAADRLALERFNVTFDEDLAAWMSHHHCRGPGLLAFVSTHPSHRQRIRALRQAGSP